MTDFVHFRARSSFSMLESALKVEHLVKLAAEHNMSSICLADRGNLFGMLEFSLAAVKHKLKPIHGVILNLQFKVNNNLELGDILLIAKDETGYKNLLKLVGASYLSTTTEENKKITPYITIAQMEQHAAGLVALSCYTQGIVGKLLQYKKPKVALAAALSLQKLFKDRLYFDIARQGYELEQAIEPAYLNIAAELNIPLLATNDVLFADLFMHEAHDTLTCIAQGVKIDYPNRKKVSNQCYFKSAAEMQELFKDLPEAIENTTNLAMRCSVIAEASPPLLPNFSSQSQSEEELLQQYSQAGLAKRLEKKFTQQQITKSTQQAEITAEYNKRLGYELEIICNMHFAGYFLIVSDFIKWSKANNIAVGPGRGSGAGSIIAWVLEITDVDPIEFGLLFERFLNPERVSMPDFDIDFCQERREEVINYVQEKYGQERVGQIITFGTMQAKAVIKDVARVLGLPYKKADYLTELVPFNAVSPVTLKQATTEIQELSDAAAGKGLYSLETTQEDNELIKKVLSIALILEGLHRHSSTHAAGIVIANKPIIDTVPIYQETTASMLVVQYSMKYCELAGLVKFDFLGLQTLTVITKTLELLKQNGLDLDLNSVGFNDPVTYKMLAQGLSTGVFQLESVGMKSALRRLEPDCVDDIIALGALYRPGPMENIPTYIDCKHKKKPADYLHPLLEPILKTTHGVIIYQEQVMEIARRLAGYSLGAADLLRRAMGKKVKAEMDAQEEIFINGAVANQVDKQQARSIFATVAKFAGYGFNKSHASAYGIISYQTAYLKANFPTEFLVASMNLDIISSDKINIFLQEAKLFDIEVVPPDINNSYELFKITAQKQIMFALGAIKNVAINFGKAVVEARQHGKFSSITNFIERIPYKLLNKRLLENLIKAGCFDQLHENRHQLIVSVPKLLAYASSYHDQSQSQQISLISVEKVRDDLLLEAPNLTVTQLAEIEFDVFGLFLKNHPLIDLQTTLSKTTLKGTDFIKNQLDYGNYQHTIAGVIVKKDTRMSARGMFVTLLLSDPQGVLEVTIFSEELLKEAGHLLQIKQAVAIDCDVQQNIGGYRLTALKISDLTEHTRQVQHHLKLSVADQEHLNQILHILKQTKSSNDEGNCQVTLEIAIDQYFVSCVELNNKFLLSEAELQKLQQLQ